MGYLSTNRKSECSGCEACVQACEKNAIHMHMDTEGFAYPLLDSGLCVSCGLCRAVCPREKGPLNAHEIKAAFGGYLYDEQIRKESTSGGAFSAVAEAWCTGNYAVFGAEAQGLKVFHSCITDLSELGRFRKSKYSQSEIGDSYKEAKRLLNEGVRVLFSGTPCQIAGLISFLGNTPQENLLTVDVVCEGVPSPQFVQKYQEKLKERYGHEIAELDYRNKDKPKWDFNVVKVTLTNRRILYIDRWINPFFNVWISGLMSRPSCYGCQYTALTSKADISLGDLWGVHQHCPELYGKDRGASLVLCGTEKGSEVLALAQKSMYGHFLNSNEVLKFQRRLRTSIKDNPSRESFMRDMSEMDYDSLCRKWVKPPSLGLLWSKYVWGNRQKVFMWNLKRRLWGKRG